TLIDELAGDRSDVSRPMSATSGGLRRSARPTPEFIAQLQLQVAEHLADRGLIADPAGLQPHPSQLARAWNVMKGAFTGDRPTLAGETYQAVEAERARLWTERVQQINYELFDRGTEAFTWYAIEELIKGARKLGLASPVAERFAAEALKAQLGQEHHSTALAALAPIREELEKPFRDRVFLWQRAGGPKGDLGDDEMGRVLQVPGWSNIFTQPIINRIEMLSTGVRTNVGIKVFGPDLDTVNRVCQEIEAAVKPIRGARDVVAAPIMGKGYLEVTIDRERAARYGVSVEDVQSEIETALGGRVVTYTVEQRERYPVRVRYGRVSREDDDAVRRLLIPASMTAPAAPGPMGEASFRSGAHAAVAEHVVKGKRFISLTAVADVRLTDGPALVKSENGQLLNYVPLNVRGRDAVGFVDEASRVVAQKVALPEGVHVEWAGEFEHEARAARTLMWVFPAVLLVIFVILYLTYHDLA